MMTREATEFLAAARDLAAAAEPFADLLVQQAERETNPEIRAAFGVDATRSTWRRPGSYEVSIPRSFSHSPQNAKDLLGNSSSLVAQINCGPNGRR
jgi:hypothetical protein